MVDVRYATNIAFEGNVFARAGGNAITVFDGATGVTIRGNHFSDIGGGAIWDTWTQSIAIDNNYVNDTGRTYFSVSAITVMLTSNTVISHNEVDGASYSGISLGWGWGHVRWATNNWVVNNIVKNVMKSSTRDGGAIYSNMPSSYSFISNNWLSDIGYRNQGSVWAIYGDSGVTGQNVLNNLVELDGSLTTAHWLKLMWGGNLVASNYSTQVAGHLCSPSTAPACEDGGANTVQNNDFGVTYPSWANALRVAGCSDATCAGLQSSYMSIKSIVP